MRSVALFLLLLTPCASALAEKSLPAPNAEVILEFRPPVGAVYREEKRSTRRSIKWNGESEPVTTVRYRDFCVAENPAGVDLFVVDHTDPAQAYSEILAHRLMFDRRGNITEIAPRSQTARVVQGVPANGAGAGSPPADSTCSTPLSRSVEQESWSRRTGSVYGRPLTVGYSWSVPGVAAAIPGAAPGTVTFTVENIELEPERPRVTLRSELRTSSRSSSVRQVRTIQGKQSLPVEEEREYTESSRKIFDVKSGLIEEETTTIRHRMTQSVPAIRDSSEGKGTIETNQTDVTSLKRMP